jgi:hypothetical protein
VAAVPSGLNLTSLRIIIIINSNITIVHLYVGYIKTSYQLQRHSASKKNVHVLRPSESLTCKFPSVLIIIALRFEPCSFPPVPWYRRQNSNFQFYLEILFRTYMEPDRERVSKEGILYFGQRDTSEDYRPVSVISDDFLPKFR